MSRIDIVEQDRLKTQRRLETQRTAAERNRLGQFATPPPLALNMLAAARDALGPSAAVRLLDPALGTGVFHWAAAKTFGRRLKRAWGFEIDPATAREARRLWTGHGLEVIGGDFCTASPPARERDRANLIVCNPPYVRHHHLAARRKQVLRERLEELGLCVNGLAGLYAYFLLLADAWLCRGGVGVWIVPAELLDAVYGRPLKAYLSQRVTLLRVHRFDPAQSRFDDALVSSVIVVLRKAAPAGGQETVLSFGGSLDAPQRVRRVPQAGLDPAAKWGGPGRASRPAVKRGPLTIGDLFVVRRGLATGANDYFILDRVEARRRGLPKRFLRPVLPGPRFIDGDAIERGPGGFPAGIRQLVLLDCPLAAGEIRSRHPGLARYLEIGRRRGIHLRYLPRHRNPWYAQERRPPAPILCTYMGRRSGGRFIRFLRNDSEATAANVYHVLYPRPGGEALLGELFDGLRQIGHAVGDAGRTYGGGLVKVEPKELAAIRLPEWVCALVRRECGAIGRTPARC